MHNPLLSINRYAEAAIVKQTIVRAGTVDEKLRPATASSQPLFGIADMLGADIDKRVDVHTHGFALVKLGGTVAQGDPLTADASSNAIAATFGSNGVVYIIGFATKAGVAGDLVGCRIAPAAVLNEDGIITVDVTLSTAQLLALNATPIQVAAAPGANKANVVEDVIAYMPYNSAAYAGIASNEDLVLRDTNGSGTIQATIETTGFLDQTSTQVRVAVKAGAITPTPNAALVAHMTTGEIITGNSPVKLRIRYRIIDTVF